MAGVIFHRGNTLSLLYRGVSKQKDLALNGQLFPNRNKSQIVPLYDGKIRYDGTFTYGESEDNAARAQQIETSLYDGCFISTTKKASLAVVFATSKFSEEGWVYILDPNLFEKYGIVSREFPDPLYPAEFEVSIRAVDCGAIPPQVIVEKYEVDSSGNKKI